MNLRFFAIETAQSLDQALDIANRSGIPAQNFVVATSDGHIGWSIAGRIPRRVGFDGRVPVSRADGTRRWDGWMAPEEYARVVDPPSGRIYTANNRVAGGAFFQALGLGSYDEGARARQIRDDLLAIGRATPADMLKVQLDDRAVFLERWRGLALSVLSDAAVAGNQARQEFRRLVRDTWSGRASIESAGYRLVRAFRLKVAAFAFGPVLEPVRKADPSFPATPGLAYEGPLWRLVAEQPRHLLSPAYAGWNGLLLAAADGVAKDLTEGGRPLEGRTWGERNTVQIRHPLTRALPLLSRWLDMPPEELPGDSNMPRVQSPEFGASERLAVSPGREEEGYFHMPGGQSGHPLSPYYRAGHRAWAQGEPASFLPGPAVHRLRLAPAR
jgi:penicillin amidase